MGSKGVVVFVVTAALMGLLVGCDSGDQASETTEALSKAAYVKQANAICEKTKDEITTGTVSEVRKLANDPEAREDLEFKIVSSVLVPSLEHQVEQLKALGTPPGDSGEIEQMLKLVEGAVAEAKSEPETYVSGDNYKWGSEHFGEAHRLALKYGIDNCPVSE